MAIPPISYTSLFRFGASGRGRISIFIHNLESVELQVIGLIRRPQNWVIRSLGAVFYLTETFVDVVSRLVDGFVKSS